MRHRNLRGFFLLSTLIFLSATVSAFGYMHGSMEETVSPGDVTTFEIYLTGEEDEEAFLADVQKPDEWQVSVEPSKLDFGHLDTYRYVRAGRDYRKITPITVRAELPTDAAGGMYEIIVSYTSVRTSSGGSGKATVDIQQVQDFTFTVDVEGGETVTMGADFSDDALSAFGIDASGRPSLGETEALDNDSQKDVQTLDGQTSENETGIGNGSTPTSEEDNLSEESETENETGPTGMITAVSDNVLWIILFLLFQVAWGTWIYRRWKNPSKK